MGKRSPRNPNNGTLQKLRGIREADRERELGKQDRIKVKSMVTPLAAIFRRLLVDRGIVEHPHWSIAVHKFLLDPRNAIRDNKKDRALAKGNLQKELLSPDMTFKKWLKGLRFLDFEKIKITVEGTLPDGKVLVADNTFSLGKKIIIPDEKLKMLENERESKKNSISSNEVPEFDYDTYVGSTDDDEN